MLGAWGEGQAKRPLPADGVGTARQGLGVISSTTHPALSMGANADSVSLDGGCRAGEADGEREITVPRRSKGKYGTESLGFNLHAAVRIFLLEKERGAGVPSS